jgi:hypothetical protein
VASARIVLVAMPRMLRDLIAGVVESETDMQLVEPGGDAPDTIVVPSSARLVALDEDGARASVYRRHEREAVVELTPEALAKLLAGDGG